MMIVMIASRNPHRHTSGSLSHRMLPNQYLNRLCQILGSTQCYARAAAPPVAPNVAPPVVPHAAVAGRPKRTTRNQAPAYADFPGRQAHARTAMSRAVRWQSPIAVVRTYTHVIVYKAIASSTISIRAASTPFDVKPTAKQADSSSPLPQSSPPQAASGTHTHHVYADT